MPVWVPLMAGLEDGVSPCALIICSVFLLMCLIADRKGWTGQWLPVFLINIYVASLILAIGFFGEIVGGEFFQAVVLKACYVLAAFFAVLGAVFFYDWLLLLRGKDSRILLSSRILGDRVPSAGKGILIVVSALALLMVVVASAWPMNHYMVLISNEVVIPGKFWSTVMLMAVYVLVSMWFLLGLLLILKKGRLTPRLRQVICAAVFLSTAGAVLLIL